MSDNKGSCGFVWHLSFLISTKVIDQWNFFVDLFIVDSRGFFVEFDTESTSKLSWMGDNWGIHAHELFMFWDGLF